MGRNSLPLADALDRLIAVIEDVTTGRADMVKAAHDLRRTTAYKRYSEDPLHEAIAMALSDCAIDGTHGHLIGAHERPLTVPELCTIVEQPSTPANLCRVGKIVAGLGYRRVPKNNTWPTPRLMAPRHLW